MTPAAVTAMADPPAPTAARPVLQRARGLARLSVVALDGRSRLAGLHQAGSSRIRHPRTAPDAPVEAVLLNTAGGMTGGDRFATDIAVGPGASAVVTSQAAERIYRSPEGSARVDTRLTVSGDGCLAWMPQETILFNRSSLDRSLTATLDGGATLIALEAVILGRTAMGERLTDIHLADAWRITRDGRLVFADATRLDGDSVSVMNGAATGNGAVAFATLVVAAPDAGRHLEPLRSALDGMPGEAGASVFDALLVARMIAANGQALRAMAVRALTTIRAAAMPRVWTL